MRTVLLTVAVAAFATSASAHVVVAPQQSQAGASQVYKVRVHNEEKAAVSAVELDIPEGVAVTSVAPLGTGKVDTVTRNGRIVTIVWTTEVAPAKYVELAFTATNPNAAGQASWNVRERFTDGTLNEWSDKPAAKLKASVTKFTPKP